MKTILLLFSLSGLWGTQPEPTGQCLLITSHGQVDFYDVDSTPSTLHSLWQKDGCFRNCTIRTNPYRLVCYVNNGIYEVNQQQEMRCLISESKYPSCESFAVSPNGEKLLFVFSPGNQNVDWMKDQRGGIPATTRLDYASSGRIAVLQPSGSVTVLEDTLVNVGSHPYWLNNDEILFSSLDSIIKIRNVVTGKTVVLFDGGYPLPLPPSDYFLFSNGVAYTSFTPPAPPSSDPRELKQIGWSTEGYIESKGLYMGSVSDRSVGQRISVFPRSLIPNSLRRKMENRPDSLSFCRESGRIVFWIPSKWDYAIAADTTLYVSTPVQRVGEINFMMKRHFPFSFIDVSEVPAGSKEWVRNLAIDISKEADVQITW